MADFDLQAWFSPHRARLSAELQALFGDAWPQAFGSMCQHPLSTAGKLMRPLLTLAAYEAVSATPEDPSPVEGAALAIELVHTYSLVHDDMPCMDNDDLRRGQPTTHVLYGDAFGLLVGDALLTEAFHVLITRGGLPPVLKVRLVEELSAAAGYRGMIGGQAADLGAAGPVRDAETLIRLHNGKTGALIRCAVRMGAIAGKASVEQLERLTRFAEAVGLAFQLADDVLDLEQDEGEEGPPSFPKLIGLEETCEQARFLTRDALDQLQGFEDARALEALARFTIEREH
ncbi:MAG: polyprenyl synthetase family protein [Alphaproteobacteria bacterium]|nr:polyprenyl synthetase family protein [Alphaproteobacteria bacterium]MCB9792931.1 polyprenyl synthetase family protein [Alphaproteobacteria bacterium]